MLRENIDKQLDVTLIVVTMGLVLGNQKLTSIKRVLCNHVELGNG